MLLQWFCRLDRIDTVRIPGKSQYSSLNNFDGRANIDGNRALIAAPEREITHFSLDPALIPPIAAGGNALVEYFLQHRFMKFLPVPRGK
jgi:hypothetical protein